jgi:HEPN domain-containing protein
MASSVPEQWAAQARYDLDTARAMLAGGRYLYVLFCCQQAVEKMLKAIIAERTGECPPRLHNLLALADRAGVVVDNHRTALFENLTQFYIQSRYAEDFAALSRGIDRPASEVVLRQAEEVLIWLKSML